MSLPFEGIHRAMARSRIFGEVSDERGRQIAKWGEEHQTHPHMATWVEDGTASYWQEKMAEAKAECDRLSQDEISWEDILWEEVTEAFCETEWPKRRVELIQVMAVACAEIEDGDTKARKRDLVEAELDKALECNETAAYQVSSKPAHPGESGCNSAGAST